MASLIVAVYMFSLRNMIKMLKNKPLVISIGDTKKSGAKHHFPKAQNRMFRLS
jgi:hypothetical protein